jgi:hypothetical protein
MVAISKRLKKMPRDHLAEFQIVQSRESVEYLLAEKEWDRRKSIETRIWATITVISNIIASAIGAIAGVIFTKGM